MDWGKRIILNSGSAFLYEGVSIICGFILPRLILSRFGSSYNGLIQSITQFISYISLLKGGIGGVSRAALYKPLAQKDVNKINGILNATSVFMNKVIALFGAGLVAYAFVYPLLVRNEFDYFFTFSLVLIIGISTFAQSYLVVAYQMLLKADQKVYISMCIDIVTTVLNTVAAALIISLGFGIHAVKLGSAGVYLLTPALTKMYVKKHYRIDRTVPADNAAISQRWEAFAHQLASFVHGNTDIVILTIFSNTLEISVYSVYYLIIHGVRRGILALTTGVEDIFGRMIAKEEKEMLARNFGIYECILFGGATLAMTATVILCTPFVRLYTAGIRDVNYIRPEFGCIAIIGQFFYCVRVPYESVVKASGHFKQTRNGAIAESVINIVLSLILVIPLGIVGVALGTLSAMVFRTIQYTVYAERHIIFGVAAGSIRQWMISVAVFLCSYFVSRQFLPCEIGSFRMWVIYAVCTVCQISFLELALQFIFNRTQLVEIIMMLVGMLKRGGGKTMLH